MLNINELKDATNTKTLNFVLLSLVTAGIYPVLWLYKYTPIIEKIIGKNIADESFIIWMAICIGIGKGLAGMGDEDLAVAAGLFALASAVLYIVWAFKAKAAIEEFVLNKYKIDLRMNVFYTLGFTIFYVNYCINNLPESKRRQEILTGKQVSQIES